MNYIELIILKLVDRNTIKDIPNWMNGEQIIQDYNFLVVDKPSISSTEIIKRVKNKENISDLVNINVINLIEKYYK